MNNRNKSTFTEKEMAEAHVFAHNLSPTEKKEADEEMRMLRLAEMLCLPVPLEIKM